jgi:hypothetical protein
MKTSFPEYLIFALNKYNESSLCKSALYCVSNIVNAIGYLFNNYSGKIIPVLIDILTNDEASRYNKTTAITLLGEICFNIKDHFISYLDTVMKLLISAADMAADFNDYEDEDTVEYINNLRFELIEAFTCISFGLDDCNSKHLFIPYVPNIFNFFKKMMANTYQHKFVIFCLYRKHLSLCWDSVMIWYLHLERKSILLLIESLLRSWLVL